MCAPCLREIGDDGGDPLTRHPGRDPVVASEPVPPERAPVGGDAVVNLTRFPMKRIPVLRKKMR